MDVFGDTLWLSTGIISISLQAQGLPQYRNLNNTNRTTKRTHTEHRTNASKVNIYK